MQGDNKVWFEEIIKRLPQTWVDKGNHHGNVFVRTLSRRGYHIAIDDHLQKWLPYLHKKKDFIPFKKFLDKIKAGDSILVINNPNKSKISMMDVSIHEYFHFIQKAMPKLDAYFGQLWRDRTAGEKTRRLSKIQQERGEEATYGKEEVGRRDAFVHVYYGKNYGNDDNPEPLEVLTMTFEAMLGTGGKEGRKIKTLFEKDRELFQLALGLLVRFKP